MSDNTEFLTTLDGFLEKWGWTDYRFCVECGLTRSTVSTWRTRGTMKLQEHWTKYILELDFRMSTEKVLKEKYKKHLETFLLEDMSFMYELSNSDIDLSEEQEKAMSADMELSMIEDGEYSEYFFEWLEKRTEK